MMMMTMMCTDGGTICQYLITGKRGILNRSRVRVCDERESEGMGMRIIAGERDKHGSVRDKRE